jgi:hypothetical protein
MDEHLQRLFKLYCIAMNRWEVAFKENHGNLSTFERHLSKKAYWAYWEWKTAEKEG